MKISPALNQRVFSNPGRMDSAAIPVSTANRPPGFNALAIPFRNVPAFARSRYPKLLPKQYAPSNSETQGRSHMSPRAQPAGNEDVNRQAVAGGFEGCQTRIAHRRKECVEPSDDRDTLVGISSEYGRAAFVFGDGLAVCIQAIERVLVNRFGILLND